MRTKCASRGDAHHVGDRDTSLAAADGTLSFGTPVELKMPSIGAGHFGTQYDVSSDGRRIYFLDREAAPRPHEISMVLGWRGLLR